MRKLLVIISVLLMAACAKENHDAAEKLSVVTYDVCTLDIEMEIKASGAAAPTVNVLWYGVYHKQESGQYVQVRTSSVEIVDPASIEVPVTLVQGQEYRVIFVAQNKVADTFIYNIDANGHLSLNAPDALPSDGNMMDLFVHCDVVTPYAAAHTKDIELERPVGQVNIATSAQELPQSISVELGNVPVYYDIFEECCSEETQTLKYAGAPMPGTFDLGTDQYSRLALFSVLAGNDISCSMTLHYADPSKDNTLTVAKAKTAPNFKTNIVGNIY